MISRGDAIVDQIRIKAVNPRWHRAIRLYGLRLVENKLDHNQQWAALIGELSRDGTHKVESDLVLESIAFAANAESLLEQIWTRLIDDRGALLNRLLTRFLHVATFPDPQYATLSEDVAAAALLRIPVWPLWPPILRVLHMHRGDAIPLATEQITRIADLWLKHSGERWPLRDEAGQILLDATHFAIGEIRKNRWHGNHDMCANVLARCLTAATVRPIEVAELAVLLVERREYSLFPKDSDDLNDDHQGQKRATSRKNTTKREDNKVDLPSLLGLRGPLADPWPDGPLRRVNHEVRDGFLSSSNPLQYLFKVQPKTAKEVLLALLIREPLPTTRDAFDKSIVEFLPVHDEHGWTPGIFFHGPFLAFLKTDWETGIETVTSLINFVTERWIDKRDPRPPSVSATIDGERIEYFGSSEAYYWYRDSVRSPKVVVPALMALEQWLYLCLEHDGPIKPAIRQILRSSRSTALLGVLTAVGRKEPRLFGDELQKLVPIWQLQAWEDEYKHRELESLLGITMMQWTRWGEHIFNMARDWHTLEHRKTTLGDVLFERFITSPKFRSAIKASQAGWKKELAALGDSHDARTLEKITLRFDKRNWRARNVANGVALEFVEPKERTQRLARA